MVRIFNASKWASAAACALMGSQALAQSLEADYSAVANPNGVWSYGEFITPAQIPGGLNQLHPVSGFPFHPNIHIWNQGFPESAYVSKNINAAPINVGTTLWDPAAVVLRPGINDQAPFVRFTAPAPALYSYNVTYSAADTVGGEREVITVVNGIVAHSDPLVGPVGVSVNHGNAAGVPLNAGDTVEFIVTSGLTIGDYLLDTVRIRAFVDPIGPIALKFPCCIEQPWTKPLSSHPSVVRTCQGDPVPFARVAMDDFSCPEDAEISRLTWWGANPTSPDIPQRNFHVRIWLDLDQCFPEEPILAECVRASVRREGVDCEGLPIFHFSANLGSVFTALAGDRYFLEIAEVDNDPNFGDPDGTSSPNPGLVDFAWSGHRCVCTCPAIQRDLNNFFTTPLLDHCDDMEVDLAFTMSSRNVIIGIPPFAIKPAFRIEIRSPATQFLRDEIWVEPDLASQLQFSPSVPEGNYQIVLYGMATPGVDLGIHFLPASGEVNLGLIALPLGDADNTGTVDFGDMNAVLGNWLAAGPWPLPFP